MLPPVHVSGPPDTGVVPPRVPLLKFTAPGCQVPPLPVPLKFRVPPPLRLRLLPLAVVLPARLTVPEPNVQEPLKFSGPEKVYVPPEPPSERPPAPAISEPAVLVKVPPEKSKSVPVAALMVPELVPPPASESVPLLMLTVPLLKNGSVMEPDWPAPETLIVPAL